MKRGKDGIWKTVGGIPVSYRQQVELNGTDKTWKGVLDETLDKRSRQINRVVSALSHLPVDRQVATVCMWMSIDEVDEMLKTLEKS